jgi:hypothetical protein
MWYRVARLTFHSILTQCSAEDLAAINRTYDLPTIELIREFALATEWDISVEIQDPSTKAAKRQEALALFQAGVIDHQTLLEMLDLDTKKILQRMNNQAQAAVAGAETKDDPAQRNGSGSGEKPAGNGSSNRPTS